MHVTKYQSVRDAEEKNKSMNTTFVSKRWWIVPLILLVLLFLPQQTYAFPAKDYYADQFNSDITIQNNGSLLIKETEVFHFIGGPFHQVYRDLPTDNTDGIDIQQVSIDGKALTPGTSEGNYEVTSGNPQRVTWHFAGASDVTKTFEVTYLEHDVIQKNGHYDSLHAIVLPTQHSYPIHTATITIHYPTQTHLLNAQTEEYANITKAAQLITFAKQDIDNDATLHIILDFPGGSLITTPPQWQQQQIEDAKNQAIADQRASTLALPSLLAALLVLIFGIFGSIQFKRIQQPRTGYPTPQQNGLTGRIKHIPTKYDQRRTDPPDNLQPAEAGALLDSSQIINAASQVNIGINQALATLFDLANRGILSIKEDYIEGEKTRKPRSEFCIELESHPDNLKPHEESLLNLLFEESTTRPASAHFTDFARKYAANPARFNTLLEQEMAEKGLLNQTNTRLRARLLSVGRFLTGLGVIGMVIAIAAGAQNGFWPLFMILLALTIVGIVILNQRNHCYALTPEGERRAQDWQGFYAHLYDIVHGHAPEADLDSDALNYQFVRNLPYAASFGMGQDWIDHFQSMGITSLPPWFLALTGKKHKEQQDGSLSPLNTMFLYSHPPYGVYYYPSASSSSGFGSGASGNFGGGFSGGGFSGGGGSGAS
jgi:uncharacterized protein (TIGR04222 family)